MGALAPHLALGPQTDQDNCQLVVECLEFSLGSLKVAFCPELGVDVEASVVEEGEGVAVLEG